MQNTMVGGGGNGWLGEKVKMKRQGKKLKKGTKKGGKLHEKRGKGLKNASFWVINFKTFRGGGSSDPLHPPAVGRGFATPAAYLFVRNYIKNGEKGLENASIGEKKGGKLHEKRGKRP